MSLSQSPLLCVEHIETRFGSKEVHSDISFTAESGSVNALIGESGCGKSVLLREILGLLRPSGGKISLFDRDVWKLSEQELGKLRTRFAVLFQDSALFSALTVAENVAVPIQERMHLDEKLVRALVDLRLYMSGLNLEHRDKMPSELSGGMRKRAALARALSLEPEILFLDEPTSGLDPITARGFDRVLRTLADGMGVTVLLVTHDVDTVLGIVDNLVVLGEGRVLAQGPVSKVRQVKHRWIQEYFSVRKEFREESV